MLKNYAFRVKVLTALLILFIVALCLLFYFIFFAREIANDTRLEIIKSLLQLVVLAIIGGTVAALFKAIESDREKNKIRAQKKQEFTKQLTTIYRTVKCSRRKLKAGGIAVRETSEMIYLTKKQLEIYHKQLDILDDAQLELEGLSIEAEKFKLFPGCEEIAAFLDEMASYLRKVNDESEKNPKLFQMAFPIDINTLEYIREFTFAANKGFGFVDATRNEHRYRIKFSDVYHRVIEKLYSGEC